MSSPCLSGSRPYVLDLELVKSPSRISQTSSPSSTLSETTSSPLEIVSTRKARAPRKRPNQTYNEAAALLSTAYPNIFSTKHFTASNPAKFPKPHVNIRASPLLLDESSELLLPFRVFDNSGFLLHQPVKDSPPVAAGFFGEPRGVNLVMSPCEKSCQSSCSTTTTTTTTTTNTTTWEVDSMEVRDGYREEDPDFDAESILDEEIEEGIDSIMGNLSVGNEDVDGSKRDCYGGRRFGSWYTHPIGLSLGGRSQFGGLGVRALRRVHDGNLQNFPVVDMSQISPRLNKSSNQNSGPNSNSDSNSESKPKPSSGSGSNPKLKLKLTLPKSSATGDKKKKKKVEKPIAELKSPELAEEEPIKESLIPESVNSGLRLKLNYDEVLTAWSDRGMPFPDEIAGAEGTDVSARLAQIDLFSESGGLREASVLRYKEKRRTRLFSKKIRYQVRKVNADRRPRMKGRFVRRPSGSMSHQKREE